jgi:hypothetical protein
MNEYTIWYSQTETFKGHFKAENKERAIELLNQLKEGEIDFDDLRDWFEKSKDYSLDLDPASVEEASK